jgi:hypothetical protein
LRPKVVSDHCGVFHIVLIVVTGRTLEETAALFDGEPVELIEAAGEAATQHTVRYFVGRDTRDIDAESDSEGSKRPPSDEHKGEVQMFEEIEMSQVSYTNTDSRGGIDPALSSTHGDVRGTDRSSHLYGSA